MPGGNVAAKGKRASMSTTGPRKSKEALWVVFDNRLVLPEYIVEFDLLPDNTAAPKPPIGGKNSTPATFGGTSAENDPSEEVDTPEVSVQQAGGCQENIVDTSGQLDVAGTTEEDGTSPQAEDSSLMGMIAAENGVLRCETTASVAAVQRQAPEVARHCRKLGGFLLASEHVGSDTVNPALVPLPHRIRELAEQALQMPPLVRL